MKILLADPLLAVHPVDGAGGWRVVCRPGPLADLLIRLAGPAATNGHSPRYGTMGGQPVVAIPLTDDLDRALVELVDALITLRYETGQVQFTLDLKS